MSTPHVGSTDPILLFSIRSTPGTGLELPGHNLGAIAQASLGIATAALTSAPHFCLLPNLASQNAPSQAEYPQPLLEARGGSRGKGGHRRRSPYRELLIHHHLYEVLRGFQTLPHNEVCRVGSHQIPTELNFLSLFFFPEVPSLPG